MSFFDKLKSGLQTAKERLTGGHGELKLTLDKAEAAPGETVTATVTLAATVDLSVNKVRLYVVGKEVREIQKDLDAEFRAQGRGSTRTAELMFPLSAAFDLKEGARKRFKHEIVIPDNLQFSYKGPHVSHDYEVVATADFAWAVELKDNKPFKVTGAATDDPPAVTKCTSPNCPAVLEVVQPSPIPGDLCSMKLTLGTHEKSAMHEVLVTIKSTEYVKAEIYKRRLPGSSRTDEPEAIEERMQPEVLWEETTSQSLGGAPLEEERKLNLDFIIPESCLPTYHGRGAKHDVMMTVEIRFEDQFKEKKAIKMNQELRVKPGLGDGPSKMFFVWRG